MNSWDQNVCDAKSNYIDSLVRLFACCAIVWISIICGCSPKEQLILVPFASDNNLRVVWRSGHIERLDVTSNDLWQKLGKNVSEFSELKLLYLHSVSISDQDFERISRLNSLVALAVSNSTFSVSDLKQLKKLPNFRELDILKCNLGNDIFESVDGFQALKRLQLTGNHISSIESLPSRNLPSLSELDVGSNPIDDAGFESIGKMSRLKSLVILNTKISFEGCKYAAGLFALRDYGIPNMPLELQRKLKKYFEEHRQKARNAGVAVPPDTESPFAYLDGPFFKKATLSPLGYD